VSGIPGQLKEFSDVHEHLARVDVSGVTRIINIGLLEDEHLQPGDWVLIHVGFAMSKIDEEEAAWPWPPSSSWARPTGTSSKHSGRPGSPAKLQEVEMGVIIGVSHRLRARHPRRRAGWAEFREAWKVISDLRGGQGPGRRRGVSIARELLGRGARSSPALGGTRRRQPAPAA
jgi:hydrogenase assembly chaperone HypC/HupF